MHVRAITGPGTQALTVQGRYDVGGGYADSGLGAR
jgi:hypothetical protein